MSGLPVSTKQRLRYWFSRWPVAGLLDRSPRTCWANLVSWALDGGRDHRDSIASGAHCQAESAVHRDKRCYCGKFRNGCLARKGGDES